MDNIILTYLDECYQLKHNDDFDVLWNVEKFKYDMLKCLGLDVSEFKILTEIDVDHKFFRMKNGIIENKVGFRYDGPSGPTKDDETNMRAALFHDIGYQIIKEFLKEFSFWKRIRIRRAFDKVFRRVLKADKMGFWKRQVYFVGVRGFGALFAYFMLFFMTSCQNQVNLASSVVNITVIKIQYAEDESKNSGMSGSDIKDPRNDQKGGEIKTTPLP